MLREDWPDLRHKSQCSCRSCGRIEELARQSLSTALRHAQSRADMGLGAEAATPAGQITLPGKFKGWKNATPLRDLFTSAALNVFIRPNQRRLYRIYRDRSPTPLYIGTAYKESIRKRVVSHLGPLMRSTGTPRSSAATRKLAARSPAATRSEIDKLRILAAGILSHPAAPTIKVQEGSVEPAAGYQLDPKTLHAFEVALQLLERPRAYIGTVRTFELDDLDEGI
jgi:hypothetical protein